MNKLKMWGMSMNELIIWFSSRTAPGDGGSADDYKEIEQEERTQIKQALEDLGLQTAASEDLDDLRLLLSKEEPVLLIAGLYEVEGWEGWRIIAEIRKEGSLLPVMVISGNRSEQEAVAAFAAGSNEYMRKPIHIEEFKYRVRNLLWLTGRRRSLEALLKVDGLIIDPSRRQVSRDGIPLTLTPKEYELLIYLAVHLGEICPRGDILKQVWGYHFHADTNVVDVYIRHLRLKVDKGYRNKLIHTVRGTGYVLRAPEASRD